MTIKSEFIITVTPELRESTLKELKEVAVDFEKTQSFINGVFLVETQTGVFHFNTF